MVGYFKWVHNFNRKPLKPLHLRVTTSLGVRSEEGEVPVEPYGDDYVTTMMNKRLLGGCKTRGIN